MINLLREKAVGAWAWREHQWRDGSSQGMTGSDGEWQGVTGCDREWWGDGVAGNEKGWQGRQRLFGPFCISAFTLPGSSLCLLSLVGFPQPPSFILLCCICGCPLALKVDSTAGRLGFAHLLSMHRPWGHEGWPNSAESVSWMSEHCWNCRPAGAQLHVLSGTVRCHSWDTRAALVTQGKCWKLAHHCGFGGS